MISLALGLFSEAIPALQMWSFILERPVSLEVMEDNEATIKIIKKCGSAKLRHVGRTHRVNLASVYEQFEDPCIELQYVKSAEQVADIFTKALAPQHWDHALDLLGVRRLEPSTTQASGPTGGNAPEEGQEQPKRASAACGIPQQAGHHASEASDVASGAGTAQTRRETLPRSHASSTSLPQGGAGKGRERDSHSLVVRSTPSVQVESPSLPAGPRGGHVPPLFARALRARGKSSLRLTQEGGVESFGGL